MKESENKVKMKATYDAAWVDTSMQRDKSLMALSAAGVGLLVTTNKVRMDSLWEIIFYAMGMLGFLGCIIVILWIFKRNKVQLQRILDWELNEDKNEDESFKDDPLLLRLEKWNDRFFICGLIFSILLWGYNVYISYNNLKGE